MTTPKRSFFRLILFLLFAGGLAGAGFGLFGTDLVKVSEIQLNTPNSHHTERFQTLLNTKVGDPFWKVSLADEIRRLESDPWVQEVQIRRIFPSKLQIEIQEKVPLLSIGDKKGNFYFVDSAARFIEKAPKEQVGDYPLALGEEFLKQKELREKVVDSVASLPDAGVLSRADVSHLEYETQKGFVLTLSKTGMQVSVGKDQFPVRVERTRRVVQYLQEHNISAKSVDADFSKKVVVQTK